jgi:hypothetical protein
MFVLDPATYVRAATAAMLAGKPFETLADACHRQAAEVDAAKVVNLADMRAKLRPPNLQPPALHPTEPATPSS